MLVTSSLEITNRENNAHPVFGISPRPVIYAALGAENCILYSRTYTVIVKKLTNIFFLIILETEVHAYRKRCPLSQGYSRIEKT